jgi:hypothetical protein
MPFGVPTCPCASRFRCDIAAITAIYYERRSVKEGMAPQELAAAFD